MRARKTTRTTPNLWAMRPTGARRASLRMVVKGLAVESPPTLAATRVAAMVLVQLIPGPVQFIPGLVQWRMSQGIPLPEALAIRLPAPVSVAMTTVIHRPRFVHLESVSTSFRHFASW